MSEPTPPSRAILDQIALLPASRRPLVVCDVDEVILHLIRPLERYMAAIGLCFLSSTYKLTGNIARQDTRTALNAQEARRVIETFFDTECRHQEMVEGADEALHRVSSLADVVLLTNLPGSHNKPVRQTLLAQMGITYPLLINSGPKGGAVAALAAGRPEPVVFIDDSPTNHSSVHASLPSARLIQFVADSRFRGSLDIEPHISLLTGDWGQTADFIEDILGAPGR
ncbi:hypothetical protein [Roseibium suaedae]|uniref:HAD family hydrolase n=1 Tax=Roseibium suaedae TaxID=735517 RepID=A0A1M7FLP6_9HYPH|nr:hypothetical protein [Roseibium suaedae]SHM04557.1 hypothetical protein SAMN05444272_1639 [Roseibium suaedae]